jgi:hypothetical protein
MFLAHWKRAILAHPGPLLALFLGVLVPLWVFGALHALRMTYRSALDLLYLALGLLLVGGALYAGSRRGAGTL